MSDATTAGRPGGGPCSISSAQRGGVEVAGHQVAERVQPRLAQRGEIGAGRGREIPPGQRGHLGEERAPEVVVLQHAVPARPPHRAAAAAVEERLRRRIGDLGDAVVDLVPGHRRAERLAVRAAEVLCRAEHHPHRQQAQPGDRAPARFHLVLDLAGQHLVPAADAEHGRPARARAATARGQAALAQPAQVGDGGPGPGQHHQVGVGQVGRAVREPHQHAGLGGQRVHVGEVADPRQPDHGDTEKIRLAERRRRACGRERSRVRGVLGVDPEAFAPGQHAVDRAGR